MSRIAPVKPLSRKQKLFTVACVTFLLLLFLVLKVG